MTDDLRLVIRAAKETLERYNMKCDLDQADIEEIKLLVAALVQVQLLLQQLES